MDLVREAVSILNGTRDFKAFTSSSSLEDKPPEYSTWRNMEISLEPGASFLSPYQPPFADQFDYWHFVFKSRSFLFRQASSPFLGHTTCNAWTAKMLHTHKHEHVSFPYVRCQLLRQVAHQNW